MDDDTTHKRGIEMMIGGALAFRKKLALPGHDGAREFASFMVAKLEMELADHMDDVREALERLRLRTDVDGRAILAFAETLLRQYDDAEQAATAALDRARPVAPRYGGR